MRVSHRMTLEDFAAQLRVVVGTQPFSAQRELTIDLIDQILSPDEIDEIKAVEHEAGVLTGEEHGRESMHGEMLAAFERDGLDPAIGLTETQHEQILELLGEVKP